MRSEAEKHLERASHLHATGAFAEALAAYEAALAGDPDLVPAAVGLARVRELRGQWSHAAEAWARVLEIDPEHAEGATARAECLRQSGCYQLALPAYDAALVLDGEQLYALAGKAECLRMLGRPQDALHWFDRSLAVHPEHTFALRGKAAALNALARYEDAIPYWEHAAALDPTSTFAAQGLKEARLGQQRAAEGVANPIAPTPGQLSGEDLAAEIERDWGRALAQDERWGEAAAAFERSLVKRGDRPEVLRELARVYEQAGRWEDAAVTWGRVQQLQPERPEPLAAQGDAQRNARRYTDALHAYDRALSVDEHQVTALAGKAETIRLLGRYEEAITWFDRALLRKPTLASALRGKAASLNALERWEDARPVWRQALAIDPSSDAAQAGLRRCEEALSAGGALTPDEPTVEVDPAARARARRAYELGRNLMQQGRFSDAAAELRLATDEDPSWTSAWYLLGLCHGEDRHYRLAIRAFEEVLARDPDHVDAAVHRADAMRRNNDYLGAISSYERILELRPTEARAVAGKAEALRMLGRFEEAAQWFDRTLQLRPRQYLALCGKAASLNALRRYDEAYPLWLAALRENPNASFVKRGLAQCRTGLGDREPSEDSTPAPVGRLSDATAEPSPRRRVGPDAARTVPPSPDRALPVVGRPMQLARSLPPVDRGRAQTEIERGRALYKDRRYADAIAAFELALRHDPNSAEAALRLGMALEDDKQYQRAVEAYERCLQIDPGHVHAATNIGEALRKSERYTDAISAYDRALALRPDYLYALAGRAECMRMEGDHAGCLAWFDKALAVGPRHAFAVQGKAAALNALTRYKEARALWERALEIEPTSQFAKEGKAVCDKHLGEEEEVPESPTPVLDEQARDLSALARAGKLSPVVGREAEIRAVMKTLVRRLKANPLLLGDPGVGKTAVVEGVAQALAAPDAPERLRHLRILELSMGSLLAGTKYRGTFEERLKDILREARENPEIVLFVDEIHTLIGAGRTEGGSLDAANILKPALARGEVTLIGATTVPEYRKHFESDSAFDRRFQPIHVEEPTPEATVQLLERVAQLYEQHHEVKVASEALAACVKLAVRFVPDRRLPDKALDLLDEVCADVSLNAPAGQEEAPVVDAQCVARVVSQRTSVPVHHLTEVERDRLGRIEEELRSRVIGQDPAVAELAAAIRLSRSGLRAPHRPRGVFLFAGASGVGKTELARALADFLFPEGKALVKLDMSEYAERFTGTRLLGAPPGYQGHGEEGQLTGPLRRRPYSVVLLDEFEKAHEDVQTMFLSLFDEGTVTDAEGRKVHAHEAFFVLTTNAGSEVGRAGRLGFGGDSATSRRTAALERAKQRFRPELLNRLDGVVVFEDLDADDLEAIAELHLSHLARRAAEQGVTLTWTPEVRSLVATHGADPRMGARPVLRAIDELVAEPLGRALVEGNDRRSVHAFLDEGRVTFGPPEDEVLGPQPEAPLTTDEVTPTEA
ncbi:MAG: tetratricopeptide repeat protein [Alphaproteobacteria bacterium]|nr:tetratricopeptide repeat protein [Alphaproteobacteria bacterium]